jgi:hypothetical protein
MFKRYRFWLWAAIVLLFANALIHSLTLFIEPAAQNETERQLRELMTSYRIDFGAGFRRNTKELVTALSSSFSLLCLLAGLTLSYLARQNTQVEMRVLKGVVGMHLIEFALCFIIVAVFTFLPPIILMGLIFLSLLMAYLSIPSSRGQESVRS